MLREFLSAHSLGSRHKRLQRMPHGALAALRAVFGGGRLQESDEALPVADVHLHLAL